MWAQQQRNVKLRFSVVYLKCDFHDGIEALDLLRVLITCSIEAQTVEPGVKSILTGKQLRTAAVGVRARGTQHDPVARDLAPFQAHRHVFCWLALSDVQHVNGDSFHEESHFFRRMCII